MLWKNNCNVPTIIQIYANEMLNYRNINLVILILFGGAGLYNASGDTGAYFILKLNLIFSLNMNNCRYCN